MKPQVLLLLLLIISVGVFWYRSDELEPTTTTNRSAVEKRRPANQGDTNRKRPVPIRLKSDRPEQPPEEIAFNTTQEEPRNRVSAAGAVDGILFPDLGSGSPFDDLSKSEIELFSKLYLETIEIQKLLSKQLELGEIDLKEFASTMQSQLDPYTTEMENALGAERLQALQIRIVEYTSELENSGDVLNHEQLANSPIMRATID